VYLFNFLLINLKLVDNFLTKIIGLGPVLLLKVLGSIHSYANFDELI